VPGLNTTIFGNEPLAFSDWLVVMPLMLVPALVAELHKVIRLRMTRAA